MKAYDFTSGSLVVFTCGADVPAYYLGERLKTYLSRFSSVYYCQVTVQSVSLLGNTRIWGNIKNVTPARVMHLLPWEVLCP
jgi:hypothetical protein